MNARGAQKGQNNSSLGKFSDSTDLTLTHNIFTSYSHKSNLKDRKIDQKLIQELEDKAYDIMSLCARFESCNAPKCPLDPLINLRYEEMDDPKCKMSKKTRHKYWGSLPEDLKKLLPYEGYFEKEYNYSIAARKRINSLPEDKKLKIISNLKRFKKVKD